MDNAGELKGSVNGKHNTALVYNLDYGRRFASNIKLYKFSNAHEKDLSMD